MIAILGGLGAAVCWAAATVCSSRSSRQIGAPSVLAWVMLVGLIASAPAIALTGIPAALHLRTTGWLALAGGGNVVGLLLEYAAFRIGKVGIVAPIASTEGAIAAVIAVIAGERLSPNAGAVLGVIALGVVLASMAGDGPRGTAERRDGPAALLAIGAAVAFGTGLYAAGRISQDLPVAWVLLPARLVGVVAVGVPLAVAGRLWLTPRAIPLVVAAGLGEVAGFVAFAVGARHGIAVSAVLGSQFAALSAVAAYVWFRERLTRVQLLGVGSIAAGVAVLTALLA